MNAAIVDAFDKSPRYGSIADPVAAEGEMLVKVHAAALSNLVKGQASGRHYSSQGNFPFVPGHDGVGTLPDGRRVNHCVGVASLGGATLDNEENYLIKKLFNGGLGMVSVENQARI